MQRSFSTSSADHRPNDCSSAATCRHLPVRLVYNNANDFYSSATDAQYKTHLQPVASTSSASSISSTCAGAYHVLPVQYSSLDQLLPPLPNVTANERGINVRIQFNRPHRRHKRRHHRRHHTEEYEHRSRRHMTKEQQHYGSCPVLNGKNASLTSLGPSNITYIETRSIVRNGSADQLNKNRSTANTRIRHIPLKSDCISTRIIREEEEC